MRIEKIIQTLNEENIIFAYSGSISQNVLANIAKVAKNDISLLLDTENRGNKIYEIIIEMCHNILFYSHDSHLLEDKTHESQGACIISKEAGLFCVTAVNFITPDKKERIKDKIDTINSMDKQQQKHYTKELLFSESSKHKKGAGLGFLEIARRSSRPLQYRFFQDGAKMYFALSAYV
ncbi:MAG: SiaB family protein kinase [Campylobacterota bacterium]